MQVRYNRLIAGLMIGLGVVNIGLGLWLIALGQFSPSLIIGFVVAAIGVAYANRPYFYIEDKTIVLPALIGPIKRKFSFKRPGSLEVTESAVRINTDRGWKHVPIYRFLSQGEDWKAFIKELQSHQ